MKHLQKLFLTVFIIGLFVGTVNAKEFCNSPVIKSWEDQREASAVRMLKLFLRNADPAIVREEEFRLLRTEILLAPCIPPLELSDFYLLELRRPDSALLPMAVLKGYLRKHGIPIEARDFFLGKTFWLESKEKEQ